MCKPLRSLILPSFLCLLLSAQECGYDTVGEQVTVLPDGGMELAFQHTAKTMSQILDSDPHPSLEQGWDSVHVGLTRTGREDRYYLRASNKLPAGAQLPSSYASPVDPVSEWYVQFPSTLAREERGDTVILRYERTYLALPWNPMGFLKDLEEEMDTLQKTLTAWEASELGDFEGKWEGSGALERAEEAGDTAVLRQHQAEFKDLIMRGAPSPMELSREYFSLWVEASLWSDLAFSIPIGEQFCGDSDGNPTGIVLDLIAEVLERSKTSEHLALAAILSEEGIEPDSMVFPGMVLEDFDPWDDTWLEDHRAEARNALRKTFQEECHLSATDLIEFDRRLAWLNERYRISDMKIRDQRFHLHVTLPGELLESNADTVVDGRAEWGFDIRQLFEKDVTVHATSRIVKTIPE